jgi:hypothetical protein
MGDIIAFPSNARRTRGAGKPTRAAGKAEIMFFLGVRYVSTADPPHAAGDAPSQNRSGSNRNKKRKRRA